MGDLDTLKPDGKRPGLQGPIDDAFTTPFLCVRGTGTAWNPAVQTWAEASLKRFSYEWSRCFRGELPVKDDTAVTAADAQRFNLILFGDPGSNSWLARVLPRLPIRWTREQCAIGDAKVSATDHALMLIQPNPLADGRCVVFNSGHTFHEKELASLNYLLFPRLGDWAVVKVSDDQSRPDAAVIVRTGFFDEQWAASEKVAGRLEPEPRLFVDDHDSTRKLPDGRRRWYGRWRNVRQSVRSRGAGAEVGMMGRVLLVLAAIAGLSAVGPEAGAGDPGAASESFFELKVRPVLAGTCVKCHGEKKASGGLRLDSREAMLAGGDGGPAVVPGDPEGSPLVRAVRHADDTLKMPPNKPLPRDSQDALAAWVAAGAPWPKSDSARSPSRVSRTGPSSRSGRSRRPTTRPAGPPGRSTAWSPPVTGPRGCTPSPGPTAAPSSAGRTST